jgi:chemotaxis protein histidine kinase CheA
MSMSDDEFLESLRQDFVTESQDLLENAESHLLDMEKDKNPQHLIEVNRSLHSLKGSARAVGYTDYADLVHNLESNISASPLKQKDMTAFMSTSLRCIDMLRQLTEFHANKDSAGVNSQVTALRDLLATYAK